MQKLLQKIATFFCILVKFTQFTCTNGQLVTCPEGKIPRKAKFSQLKDCKCADTWLSCDGVFDEDLSDDQKMEHLFVGRFFWLKKLTVRNAMLQNFEAGYVTTLKNLIDLDLSDNYLESIGLTYSPKVNGSQAHSGEHNTVPLNLRMLYLDQNNLNDIPQELKRLQHLEVFSIKNNFITEIKHNDFVRMKYLKYLTLAQNRITTINELALKELVSLQKLDISDNQIASLNARTFGDMSRSTKVKQLETVKLSNNLLSSIPKFLPRSVQELWLDSNNINILEWNGLTNDTYLPTLKYLNLSMNQITIIKEGAFKYCENLLTLDLSSNSLVELARDQVQGLSKIELIFLQKNRKLQEIPYGIFQELDKSLKYIVLYQCHVHSIWVNPEEKLTCPKFRSFWLFHNPFRCDCHVRPFISFKSFHNISVDINTPDFLQMIRNNSYEERDRLCMEKEAENTDSEVTNSSVPPPFVTMGASATPSLKYAEKVNIPRMRKVDSRTAKIIKRQIPRVKNVYNTTFLIIEHVSAWNKTPKVVCASPKNRHFEIANRTLVSLARENEEYFTCPYEAPYVIVSVLLGLGLFVVIIPAVFGMLFVYLVFMDCIGKLTKQIFRKYESDVEKN